MVVVPLATVVTRPLLFIVAFAVLELVHVPPPTVLLSVTALPRQADDAPVKAAGAVFTVIPLVAKHPVGIV